jgi:crotonobetainyl-CoA:carnitine CoA-transferase CaiB-like acyl-CoA transferase
MVAPYQVFTTGAGELMIAAGNDRLFAALCDVIGAPSLVDDPRFRRNPDRVTNRDALGALLEQRLRSAPAAVWHERLTAAGVPAAPVADVGEIARAPQTEALGLLQPLPHPAIPDLRLPALPLSLDHERALHRTPPPTVGQHTAEVLGEAGYDDDTIAALAARGVINA